MKKLLLGVILALSPFSVKAENLPLPEQTGRVVDTANEIPDDQQLILEKEIAEFERTTKHQFRVVTIPDLKGEDIKDYTIRLARHWGVGRASVDDGIVLLQSPGDGSKGSGKIRIEVGYGMEYILTDVETSRIIKGTMIPILKQDRPRSETTPEAIIAGAREIMRLGAITPEQIAENERLEKVADAKRAAAVKDFFLTVVALIGGGVFTWAVWMVATSKRRHEKRQALIREAEERQRLLEEQRERNRIEFEKREKERREEQERNRLKHEAMLAAMSPAERAAYDAEQARQKAARLEADRLRRIRLEKEAEEARQQAIRTATIRQQQEARRRQEEEEEERRRPSSLDIGFISFGSSGNNERSDSNESFGGGGGGDFGGGGSDDTY